MRSIFVVSSSLWMISLSKSMCSFASWSVALVNESVLVSSWVRRCTGYNKFVTWELHKVSEVLFFLGELLHTNSGYFCFNLERYFAWMGFNLLNTVSAHLLYCAHFKLIFIPECSETHLCSKSKNAGRETASSLRIIRKLARIFFANKYISERMLIHLSKVIH